MPDTKTITIKVTEEDYTIESDLDVPDTHYWLCVAALKVLKDSANL